MRTLSAARTIVSVVVLATIGLHAPTANAQTIPPSTNLHLAGQVLDSASGEPVAMALVQVSSQHIERLTSADGRFALTGLQPGRIHILIRRIGFRAQSLDLTVTAEIAAVRIRLVRLPVALPPTTILAANRCDKPGAPEPAADSSLAETLEQLRANAEAYLAFTRAHPFVMIFDRTIEGERRDRSLDRLSDDTIAIAAGRAPAYVPGSVVNQSDATMRVPSFETFAESAFVANHCFFNGGLETDGNVRRLRIEFRAAAGISQPDVDGAMYVDPDTYLLRKTVIRLSKRPRSMPWLDSVEITTTFSDIVSSVPSFEEIVARNRLVNRPGVSDARAQINRQRRIGIRFGDGTTIAELQRRESTPAPAQPPPHVVDVRLLVTDAVTKLPLTDVDISSTQSVSATTDATGHARLAIRPDTITTLRFRKIGYAEQTATPVLGRGDDSVSFTIALTRATQLDAVVVRDSARRYISPSLNAFLTRQRTNGAGRFIGDSILRASEGRRLGDLLRSQVAGATLRDGPSGSVYLLRSPRCTNGGPPQVYLDGVPLAAQPPVDVTPPPSTNGVQPTNRRAQEAAVPPFDLSRFQVSELAGVEYYADNAVAPSEFTASSQRCGILLLWTRER